MVSIFAGVKHLI